MSDSWPPGWRLRKYDTLGSTQDVAIEAARAGEASGLCVMARLQTHGRGSRGRVWQAPAGNLNFSALLRPGRGGVLQPGYWALLAGVALHEAVSPLVSDALTLKWPNDLLLAGAKLGGVLIDSELKECGALSWVVIGAGVNVSIAPLVESRRTACLNIDGGPLSQRSGGDGSSPPALLLGVALMHRLAYWTARDLPSIRSAWLSRAHPVGTYLSVRLGSRDVEGEFQGLSEDGGLMLSGLASPISTGEVFQPCS